MDGGGLGEDYPIFAVAGGYETTYQALVGELGRGAVVTLTADSGNIVSAITSGLTAATQTHIEDAICGIGNDTVIGSADDNAISGGAGNDSPSGAGGADDLLGGSGRDTLTLGDQAFPFIETAFGLVAGEVRLNAAGALEGDTNGDGLADFLLRFDLVGGMAPVLVDLIL